MTTRKSDGPPKTTGMDSVRAMMRGLGEIVDRLGQLEEKGTADFSTTSESAGGDKAVSYTHLTLPTSDLV